MADQQRVQEAYEQLVELEERGTTLSDILNGPEGHLWVQEACGGDLEVAREAFQLAHPGARFMPPFNGEI